MKTLVRLFCVVLLSLGCAAVLVAQVTPLISRVNVPQAYEKKALSIGVEFSKSTGIGKVLLKYRSFGETDFKELEMLIAGRTATATVPEEAVLPPHLEYYIEAQMSDGTRETYPIQNPEANPQRAPVKPRDPKDDEVRVLSPEPGETVDIEELVVAISFFYSGDNINRQATKIYLDNTDVSASAVLSDDVLLYSPASSGQRISLGAHRLRIELYDTEGKLYHSIESSFNASTAAAIAEEKARLQTLVDGQAEYRSEDIKSIGTSTTYIRGDLRLNGSYGILNFGGTTHIDNQEDPTRQPQNRFLAYGATDFLSLQVGDAYPRFPSYIVSGKRVRGLTANLALGFFNVDVTLGETERNIEGTTLYDTTYADTSSAATRPTNSAQLQGLRYRVFESGTFQRDFFAVRPSFGKGENFQLGFTYMKAKDKLGSIRYGTYPEENLVLGTDLMFAFDDQRIKLETQASMSLSNTDISPEAGSIEDLKKSDPEAYDDIVGLPGYDLLSSIMTINKNLVNPVGDGLPGASYEGILTLNYFNNYIRGSIFRRGASYSSMGNEFLQIDIEGFTISDRIRMFDNKVFLSIAYDKRNDNTANNKAGTTNFDYLNSTVTVVPGTNLPSFTLGYGINNQASDNTISRLDFVTTPISSADSTARSNERANATDNATNQIFIAANYDFTLGMRQSLTASLSLTDRTDKTFYKRDQSNVNLQASLTTSFNEFMQTTLGYILSQNENKDQIFNSAGRDSVLNVTNLDYSSVSAGVLFRFLDERLRVQASASPTFGSFNRTIARAGIDYAVAQGHTFELLFDYIQNSGDEDDTIASLIYRFNF